MESTGRHILLFEEDKGLERIMTLTLKQADFRVTRLSSVETTLAWLASQKEKYDESILIVDVSESDREVEQIFRQLKDRDYDLPLIIISPYGNAEVNPGEIKSNRYRILTTPFSPEEFLSCIKEVSKIAEGK
jgi:DNA-binding NtrC family response regulator